MAEFKDKTNLYGGLNSDDSPRRAPKGDYRSARNIRKKGGVINNIRGFLDLGSIPLESDASPADFKVIGVHHDQVGNRIIRLIYHAGATKEHMIVRFDIATETNYIVTKGPYLNFTDHPVTGMGMIGDIFMWANKDNPPRAIDIAKVEALGAPMSEFNLSFIKYAPTMPVLLEWNSFSSPEPIPNALKHKMFQFTHRYIYKDGSKSTFGPYSGWMNFSDLDPYFIDGISITIQPDILNSSTNGIFSNSDALVALEIAEVEIAVRNSSSGNFRSVARIPISQSSFVYTSEVELGPVPVSDVAKAYDSVPLISEDLEVVSNQVFLAGNTEDFPEISNFAIEGNAVYITSPGEVEHPVLTGYNGPTFKINSRYQLAIQFYDEAGRHPLAYTNKDLVFNTAMPGRSFASQFVSLGFKFAPSFTPPEWATSYAVLRSNSLDTGFFIQGVCNVINYYRSTGYNSEGVETFAECEGNDASFLNIHISNFYTATKRSDTQGNPHADLFYNFQEGDRVRVSHSGSTIIDAPIDHFNNNYLVINTLSPGTKTLTKFDSYLIEIYREIVTNEEGIVFYEIGEHYPILNPKTENRAWSKSDWTWTDTTGIGDYSNNYPVINGDVYGRHKVFYHDLKTDLSYSKTAFIQSMSPQASKPSGAWDHATGRPSVAHVSKPSQKVLETQIRFGGLLIPESRINNLFSFNEADQYIYPLEYGPVKKIVAAFDYAGPGNTGVMLALFTNSVISIYLGKRIFQTTNGDQQLGLSDSVLGSFNPLEGAYGTQHPESVFTDQGKVWYWCQSRECWVRYAQNGLTNLSEAKMLDEFSRIAKANNGRVWSMYDFRNKELVCRFDADTYVFSEDTNRWECNFDYSYFETMIAGYAFKGLNTFSLEKGPNYNLGQSYIEPMLSDPSTESKVLQTINVDADHAWYPALVRTENDLEYEGSLAKMTQKEWLWSSEVGFMDGTEKKMRSRSFTILLKLNPSVTSKTTLYDFFVNYSHSKPQTDR